MSDIFNMSNKTRRSPPTSSKASSTRTNELSEGGKKSRYMTNDKRIACNKCEKADERLKVRCGTCKRWWHVSCEGIIPDADQIAAGAWKCLQCENEIPDKTIVPEENNVTRTEIVNSQPMANSTQVPGTNSKATTMGTKPKVIATKTTNASVERIKVTQPSSAKSTSSLPREDQVKESPAFLTKKQPEIQLPSNGPIQQASVITNKTDIVISDTNNSKQTSPPEENKKDTKGSRHSKQTSRLSSTRSSTAAIIALVKEEYEMELAKMRLQNEQQELDLKIRFNKRQQEVLETASQASARSSFKGSNTSSSNTSRVEEWVNNSRCSKSNAPNNDRNPNMQPEPHLSRARYTSVAHLQPNVTRQTSRHNPNLTVGEFVDEALREGEDEYLNLTRNQERARRVLSKELPDFEGDPTEWPAFIARYTESTRRCGYTEVENLDRLARCLKGRALRSVKSELHKRNALPSVLATLNMLFGRPEVVYAALIQNIRDQPVIKESTMGQIITFSMNVKTLCESLSSKPLQPYLHSPLLMIDLVEKLPLNYRIMWGNYEADLADSGANVTVETFDAWLRRQAEIYTKTNRPGIEATVKTTERGRGGTTGKRYEIFQGAHVTDKNTENAGGWIGFCHLCKKSGHLTAKCPDLLKLSVDERWKQTRKFALCIKCLGRHDLRDCGSDTVCGVNGCINPHHSILHSNTRKAKVPTKASLSIHKNSSEHDDPVEGRLSPEEQNFLAIHQENRQYKFQIVPIIVSNGYDKEEEVFAFIDNGSEVSLIDDRLAKRLRLKGPEEDLKLKWTGNTSRVEKKSMRTHFTIQDATRKQSFTMKNVRTVQELSLPTQTIASDKLAVYPHLQAIPITAYYNARPSLLIGLDHYQLITPQETIEGSWNEPVAVRTRLGWTIYGSTQSADLITEATSNTHTITNDDLKHTVDEYFSLENIGIEAPRRKVESIADSKAREIMERGTRRIEDGRFEVKLLWKTQDVALPDSLPMATSRFWQFDRKIEKNGNREEINKILKEYHDRRYLIELTNDEKQQTSGKTWYLPLFTVTNPNKPGKVRLVWDAAATVNGMSLNDHLYTGPDLTANIVATLYKFREHRVAIGGDIEAMFHQIRVCKEDQDAQRCLWRLSSTDNIHVSKMQVMTFGAACSPSLAQFVKNQNALKFQQTHPRATVAITERHYVDDYLDSFPTTQEARKTLSEVVKIHQAGGFNLRGLVSNEAEVIRGMCVSEDESKLLNPDKSDKVKVLGMWWETSSDELRYRLNIQRIGEDIMNCQQTPTKREVLRTLMMIFDPLGLIGHIILKGKLVLKGIWRHAIEWDERIPKDEEGKWHTWIQDLRSISDIVLPRWYFTAYDEARYELHVFVDAGEEAAAAVAYIVRVTPEVREVALVGAKTKVGPNKPTSIPRMELQAAVIGARYADTVRQQHSLTLEKTSYWTDSRNVLCWLRSPKRFKVFVAHRIGEIRESTRVNEWRYVPTDLNPADLGTKWQKFHTPIPELWLHGPPFLKVQSEEWPKEPSNLPPLHECDLELRCNVTMENNHSNMYPDWDRFSKLNRLVRTQAYVLRVFRWGKSEKKDNKTTLKGALQKEETDDALIYLIREAQTEAFYAELLALREHNPIEKTSCIYTYSPFIDQNQVIRMHSRLQEAEYLSYDQRCPIILPRRHPLTKLIIEHKHVEYLHQNHNTVINELKQKYVIPSLRSTLKSIRSKCRTCRRRSLNPEVPEMCTLPRSRLAVRVRPFSYVGVDYFGPLLVKHGRRVEKKWGALFTCMTTRAIHIELASTLSTDTFILILRCFIARRGTPIEIFCDNGTNFHGAENELRRVAIDNCKNGMENHFQKIKFKFNPPHAPHMGGAWERLVRAVKTALECLKSERVPSDDLMRAVLTECEMLVNSRPLTYISADAESLEALTPNHFILGSSSGVKPIGNFTDDPDVLRREWKRQQAVTAMFWRRFVHEYLPEISRRTKWFDVVEPLQPEDVVAIVNPTIPGSWQLGRILEVAKSKDGNVRQAIVRTAYGDFRRPASKLAILVKNELRDEITSSAGGGVTEAANHTRKAFNSQ